LLAVVHRLVQRVVLGAPGHGDLLIHVQLTEKLLLGSKKVLENKRPIFNFALGANFDPQGRL
jgi:hypothetical protein